MASLNKVILIGNLGNDPEVREYNGRKVANFSLATNEVYNDSNGQRQERTEWFRVSFWGNTAEVVERYLKKGSQVYVEGRLSTREYQTQDGKTRFSLEVSGQSMTMLGSRSDSGGGNNYPPPNSGNYGNSNIGSTQAVSEPSAPSGDDDLPF
jgi:single-strand DNA-binding protein